MKKETNKKMTIEDLAVMVGKGFSEVHDKIDSGFARVDKKFDEIDERFDGIDKRFDGVDKRLNGIDNRLDGIDNRLDGIDKRFDGIDKKFDKVHKEIEDLAIMTGNGFREVHEKMGNRLTVVENNQFDLKLRMNILSKQQK